MLGMARLLFKLRHVEADEFDEVTTALDQAQVDWYQTSPGLLGFSAPAIWIRDAAECERARAVIADSQALRLQRLRAGAQRSTGSGRRPAVDGAHPRLRAVAALVAVALSQAGIVTMAA